MNPNHTITTMISEQEIQARIQEMANEINERYKDSKCVVLIGLLRGSAIFLADLVTDFGATVSAVSGKGKMLIKLRLLRPRLNVTTPSMPACSVWSRPMYTFSPAWNLVPR